MRWLLMALLLAGCTSPVAPLAKLHRNATLRPAPVTPPLKLGGGVYESYGAQAYLGDSLYVTIGGPMDLVAIYGSSLKDHTLTLWSCYHAEDGYPDLLPANSGTWALNADTLRLRMPATTDYQFSRSVDLVRVK